MSIAAVDSAASRSSPSQTSGAAAVEIVFQRGKDLRVTTTDGAHPRLLTRHGAEPAVSSDGRRVLFVRDRSIWVMNRDGSAQRRLTTGHDDLSPEWAADGATIYFSRRLEGSTSYSNYTYASALFRMRADGSGVTQVTQPALSDHGTCHEGASAAPNGRVIAYTDFYDCDRGLVSGVEATTPVGKPVRLRQFDLAGGYDGDWSPDGRRLAFALDWFQGGPAGIAVATAGVETRRIYRHSASRPAWSPDGRWIAFVRGVGNGRIWIVRPDGTGLRRMTSRRYDGSPAWLPPLRG
jgi:Tol biopolymer transport system component